MTNGASTMIHCVVLLVALLTSQATGEPRRSLVSPAVRSKNDADSLLLEEQKLDQNKPGRLRLAILGYDRYETIRHDANRDERLVKAELHEFASNPVVKDPVSSQLQPGDLEGTQQLYEKLKKLESDAAALEGTFKLQVYLEKQLDESESFIREHGANNIWRMLQAHDPTCHNVAHQVGRAAVRITQDINFLLEMCESGCNVGCFHGVIMGLIIDSYEGDFSYISTEEKKTYVSGVLREMCDENTIGRSRVGVCIHGVGSCCDCGYRWP